MGDCHGGASLAKTIIMNKIDIKYYWKIGKWYLPRSIKRDVAERWDELTGKQLEQVMEVLYLQRGQRDKQILCLKALMGIRWHLLFGIDDADIDGMLWLTDFLFEDINLQKNLIGSVKVGSGVYYGPQDGMKGLTAAEFMSTDRYFMNYIKCTEVRKGTSETLAPRASKKRDRSKVFVDGHDGDHWLNLFVAVLYRHADPEKLKKWENVQEIGWFGRLWGRVRNFLGFGGSRGKPGMTEGVSSGVEMDLREDFDQDTLAVRAKAFKRMPKAMKLGILNWYRSCRRVWELSLPRVFSGSKESDGSSFGWFEVMKKVNASDFGTLEQKENVPMFTIFLSMEVEMKDQEKRKKSA